MHCSGLLRGLNPPHRVKSISMATFSNDEVEKLKNAGNEENAKIWLGLHDGPVKFTPVRLDENVKNHLIQKYENRRWYVSPSEIAEQKRLLEAHSRKDSASGISVNSQKSNQSAPANLQQSTEKKNDLADLLGEDLMFPVQEEPSSVPKQQPPFATFQSPAFPISSHTSTPQPLQFDLFGGPAIPAPQTIPKLQNQQVDLFGNDFFGAALNPKPAENFANFDSIFGKLSVADTPAQPQVQQPPAPPAAAPVSNGFMGFPTSEPVLNTLPVSQNSLDSKPQPQATLEPVKPEEKKEDGPDYSALHALYTVEDEPIDFFGFGTAQKAANGLASNPNGFAKSSTIGDFGTPTPLSTTNNFGNNTGLTPNSFFSMNSFNQQQPAQNRAPWEPPTTTASGAAPVSNWNPFS